jgi:hypothetical protein
MWFRLWCEPVQCGLWYGRFHLGTRVVSHKLQTRGCVTWDGVESSFPLVKLGDVAAASANAMVMNTIVCFMLNDGR